MLISFATIYLHRSVSSTFCFANTVSVVKQTSKATLDLPQPINTRSDLCVHLDDVETHVDQVARSRAVVTGSRVTFQRIGKITTVQIVIAEVIMTTSKHRHPKLK